jgi:hypothetical protein
MIKLKIILKQHMAFTLITIIKEEHSTISTELWQANNLMTMLKILEIVICQK